eukprot:8675866-Ditylum_brightwellii.AAC.1
MYASLPEQVLVDEWLRISAPAQTAVLIKQMKQAIEMQMNANIGCPHKMLGGELRALIHTIATLLAEADE